MDTKSVPAPPAPRETVTKKALRLYPERTIEPLGHGRYTVEGTDGFYEVNLGIFDGEESCPCPATKPCYHLVMATICRAKRRVAAHKVYRPNGRRRGRQRLTSRLWRRRCDSGDIGGAALRGPVLRSRLHRHGLAPWLWIVDHPPQGIPGARKLSRQRDTTKRRTMLSEENTTTTEEQGLTCFVRHPDAGGQCWEPRTHEVHGLNFCARHGLEAELGAGLEAHDDAAYFFERFRNPHVPQQGDAIERTLEFALDRLREEAPADFGHQQALMDAYPVISEDARKKVVRWIFDQSPDELPVLDILLSDLHAMHKLLRIAYAEEMMWLVEVLEEERQGLAVQAAYLLRNPPDPDDED